MGKKGERGEKWELAKGGTKWKKLRPNGPEIRNLRAVVPKTGIIVGGGWWLVVVGCWLVVGCCWLVVVGWWLMMIIMAVMGV